MNFKISKQHGRSLVELMIAMAIGLVIMLAISSLYVTNTQTYRITDDKALMEENGRLALNMMAYHARMVGLGQLLNATPQKDSGGGATNFVPTNTAGFGIFGCSGGFVSEVAAIPTCKNAVGPDALLVSYVVDTDNANSASVGGGMSPLDCAGQAVANANSVVENRYYLASNAATGRQELYCVGNGGSVPGTALNAGRAIVDNVVDMKINYGYDGDGNQSVDGFFTAASVANLPPPADIDSAVASASGGNPAAQLWAKVVSVKICMVIRSSNDGLATTPMQYRDCSDALVTATDKRLYSKFSTVVALRGRISGRTL